MKLENIGQPELSEMQSSEKLYRSGSAQILENALIASQQDVLLAGAEQMTIYCEAVSEMVLPTVEVGLAVLELATSVPASEMMALHGELEQAVAVRELAVPSCLPVLEAAEVATLVEMSVLARSAEQALLNRHIEEIAAHRSAMAELCRPIWETARIGLATMTDHLPVPPRLAVLPVEWMPFSGVGVLMPNIGPAPILDEVMVVADAVYEAGWVPHYTTPVALVKAWLSEDEPDLSARLDDYYREHWPMIAKAIHSRLAASHADDETKAGMEEALLVHESGHYRASCRTVFPEVERAARLRFYKRLAPQRTIVRLTEFRRRLDDLNSADLFHIGRWAFRAYCALSDHAYAWFDGNSAAANDTGLIPNRHAVAHGFSAAPGHQRSVNAILLADFCLAALDIVAEQDLAA